MYCSNCGKEIADDEKFCHNCGSETALNTNKQNYQDVRSFTNTNVIRCRFCGKFIPEKSVGCPYCGNIVNPQMGQASHNPNPQAKKRLTEFFMGIVCFYFAARWNCTLSVMAQRIPRTLCQHTERNNRLHCFRSNFGYSCNNNLLCRNQPIF